MGFFNLMGSTVVLVGGGAGRQAPGWGLKIDRQQRSGGSCQSVCINYSLTSTRLHKSQVLMGTNTNID